MPVKAAEGASNDLAIGLSRCFVALMAKNELALAILGLEIIGLFIIASAIPISY
jgi:hypothetical protein